MKYIVLPQTKEELLKEVTEEEVYYAFFGEFELNVHYSSPLSDRIDKHPSFTISYWKNELMWRDFGYDIRPNDCIKLVQLLYDLSYKDAIYAIYEKIVLNNSERTSIKKLPPIESFTKCKIKKINVDQEYWMQNDISYKDLQFYNIYTGEVWDNGNRVMYNTLSKPCYVYMFSKEEKIWKAYSPYRDVNRFYANNVAGHIQNDQNIGLTGSDTIIITKSYKDAIILNKAGFDSIAPHSEGLFVDPWYLDYLRATYKHIGLLYDNDIQGLKYSKNILDKYSDVLDFTLPPLKDKDNKLIKDPWLYTLNYGYQGMNDFIIDTLINHGC